MEGGEGGGEALMDKNANSYAKIRPAREIPKGERRCEDCSLHHPERPQRPCSAFGQCENKGGCCSLYIDNGGNRYDYGYQ